jgi:hypothetical protein
MLGELTVSSPSRTYVAICVNNDDGRHFRRFALPEEVANDAQTASWFFLNRIDSAACIEGVVTTEGFENAPEVSRESSGMTGLVENFGINVRNTIARLFRPTGEKRRNLCAPIPLRSRKRLRVKTPLTMPKAR